MNPRCWWLARPHTALAGAAVACAVAACGAGGTEPSGPAPTISIAAPATVAVGGTFQMSATASSGAAVTWSSLSPTLVSVSATGQVTGVTPGVGEVKATSGAASATAQVTVLPPFVELSVGRSHACALSAQRVVFCWGDNGVAALGGTGPDTCPAQLRKCSALPRSLVASTDFAHLSAGSAGVTCGLTTTGSAMCWGNNRDGWIGPSTDTCTVEGVGTSDCVRAPVAVPGGKVFTSITVGSTFACGLVADGTAFCWGMEGVGELGSSATDSCTGGPCNRTPVAVSGGLSFISLTVGNQHACGIVAGGAAYCWGLNADGQLGSAGPGGSTPALVAGGHAFASLSAYVTHTCGVDTSGDGWCWGGNAFGQIGNGSLAPSSVPSPVSGGLKFLSVSTALEHTCGLATSGLAYCWGQNTGLQVQGQLGNGSTTPSRVPVLVSGGHQFVQLAAGRQATCGRTAGGLVHCWGDNRFGQLGNGALSVLYSTIPVGVAGAP